MHISHKSLQLATLGMLLLAACGEETAPPSTTTAPSTAAIEARLDALEDKLISLEAQASAAPTSSDSSSSASAGQSLKVQPSALTLGSGDSRDIELLTLVKADGSKVVLTDLSSASFSSSDDSIISVSESGKVTAVGSGGAVLNVNLGELSAQVPVIVGASTTPSASPSPEASATPSASPSASPTPEATPTPTGEAQVESVGLGPSTMELEIGSSQSINSVFVSFDNGTAGFLQEFNSKLDWSSSDEDVAIVSSAGVVTARAEGTATITGTYKGVDGTLTVTVNP